MRKQKDKSRFAWPGNEAILHQRFSEKSRPAHHRVSLGPYAFIKGWLVAFAVWFIISLVVAIVDSFSSQTSLAFSLWGVVLLVSFIVAVLIGTPAALVLGLLLRPMRRQWTHVLVSAQGSRCSR